MELLEMAKKSKAEKDAQRKAEEQEDEKRSAWVKRKEKQARTKQLLQNQWFRYSGGVCPVCRLRSRFERGAD